MVKEPYKFQFNKQEENENLISIPNLLERVPNGITRINEDIEIELKEDQIKPTNQQLEENAKELIRKLKIEDY